MYKNGSKSSSKHIKKNTIITFSNQNTPLLNIYEILTFNSSSGIKLIGTNRRAMILKGGA